MASSGSFALGLNQVQSPTVATDIKISNVSESEPSSINSVLLKLDKLRITPSYMNNSENLNIQLNLQMSSEGSSETKEADISFNNSETLTLSKIRDRTGKDLSQIFIDNLSGSDTNGFVQVKLKHPSIDSNTYRRDFVIPSPSIPRSVFSNSLVAWYRFEDGDARDYTSNDRIPATFADNTDYGGTVTSESEYVQNGGVNDFKSGNNSGAFQFSGDNTREYISLDSRSVNNLSDYTICMWVENPSPGEYFLSIANDSQDNELIFGQDLNSSSWEHCAVTRDSNSKNAYLNGSEDSGFLWKNRYGSDPLDVDGFIIGQEQDTVENGFNESQAHGGKVDDIRIYNEVLSKSEINDIYDATKPN